MQLKDLVTDINQVTAMFNELAEVTKQTEALFTKLGALLQEMIEADLRNLFTVVTEWTLVDVEYDHGYLAFVYEAPNTLGIHTFELQKHLLDNWYLNVAAGDFLVKQDVIELCIYYNPNDEQ